MKETIILAPGANGNELLKSLAMHGKNTFGYRIVGGAEFAQIALMRSGKAYTEDYISSREETAIIARAVTGETYFKNASYSDIQEIRRAVQKMRSLVTAESEEAELKAKLSEGIFKEKNDALFSVYEKFTGEIKDRRLMDSVSLIRYALNECTASEEDKTAFFSLEEYPLAPLEKALLDKFSGGSAKMIKLSDLFEVKEKKLKINSYKNCYGAANEVESILADIYAGKSTDRCTVAVTDTSTYAQLFFDYALLYDLPVTFGCGIPITNSNPARLLVLYRRWISGGGNGDVFGGNLLKEMIMSSAFDRGVLSDLCSSIDADDKHTWISYLDEIKDLRLTNDKTINDARIASYKKAVGEEEKLTGQKDINDIEHRKKSIPYIEVIAGELSLPADEFIERYSYIRKGSDSNAAGIIMALDKSAKSTICSELRTIASSGIEKTTDDMILDILKRNVSKGRSENGKLLVCGIGDALFSIRDNLYIAGLSASKYPGSPKENYLLLDKDLECFGTGAEHLTSEGLIIRKKKNLKSLAKLASDLGAEVNVSYSGLNVSELKEDNPSSLLFELCYEESGKNPTSDELKKDIVKKVEYFEPAVSATRKVGEAYNDIRKEVIPNPQERDGEDETVDYDISDKEFSPSALGIFFGCPRRFFFSYILGLNAPDESKPFEVIAANDSGTLAHAIVEQTANKEISAEEFLKLSGETFDRYIAMHPPLITQNVDTERSKFLEMMETAYRMVDRTADVTLKEEPVHITHEESKVNLYGFPDRVEKQGDGTYHIIDFKSSNKLSHKDDDIETCLQIVIYAYLMEKARNIEIADGKFMYIKLDETVSCRFDDDMKAALTEKLNAFKEDIKEGKFNISPEAEANGSCNYCKFGMICGKEI